MLAALHVAHDEIRLCIINPHNGEAIAKSTLSRAFKKELAHSAAALKELIANKYFQKLEAGADWAIRAGLRQRFGWTFEGSQPPPPEAISNFASDDMIKISFVYPDKPVVDVTPPAPPADPYVGRAPDPNATALPAPTTRNVSTPFGNWRVERPTKDDWMR
jgi:hypothetical protein